MTDTELQQKRLIAAAIDAGIAIALAIVVGIVGAIVGHIAVMLGALVGIAGQAVLLAYILLRDILSGDRSLGKKTQEIKVVTTSGAPLTSVNRATALWQEAGRPKKSTQQPLGPACWSPNRAITPPARSTASTWAALPSLGRMNWPWVLRNWLT